MSITKTIITAIVGLTLVALIAPVGANALTTADLQAQINALMAQLSSLQGTTAPTKGTSAPAFCAGVTFTRNLTTGATGSDVKCLQAILNQNPATQVATTGAGSPGNETSTFGPKTLVAVKAFQTAQGFTPANQVGPMTRAKLNGILAGGVTVTPITPVNPGYPPVVTPSGAGLSVMAASDKPASAAVVSNAALVPLQKLTFVNDDNAQVKVTGVRLQRIGVSADASLNNVYLFDGANRLTDAASVSSGVVSFNDPAGLFTVDASGTKTITVYADLAASSGETLGIALTSASNVTSNASSVKGNFPVNGNLMTVATATLAGVEFTGATPTPSASDVSPAKDQVVWENLTSVTTRSVVFKWIRLREIGTINYSDVGNYRLYIDGVQVGSAVASLDVNGYVTFDLTSAPLKLQTGTRDIKVLADVIAGSSRKYSFSLRVASDASFVDTQYGANVLVRANSTTFSARTTGDQTISSGTVTIQKTADSPASNVTNSASNQVLARYTVTASGERVKIDTLRVAVVANNASVGCLRNGAVFANGVQIGSTSDLYTTTNTTCGGTGVPKYKDFTVGSSLVVDPSTPVTLEIRADVYDNDGTNDLISTNTLQAELLVPGSANAQGLVSLSTSSVPAATTAANQLTVKTGTLTLSKYTAYTSQYAVVPLTNFKLSHFTLSNDTVEPVNITSIKVNLNYVSGNASNLYVQYGTQKTNTTTTVSAYTQTYSVNYQIQPSQTIDVAVYADVNSSAAGQATSGVYITGTTVNSATTVHAGTDDSTSGQTITFTSGSVTTAADDATPASVAVAGNQTVTAAKFKITASNDSYTVQEAKFTVQGNNGDIILNASLLDGTTVLATMPFDSVNNRFYFTGLNIPVATNTSKVLTLQYALSTPSADYSSNGENAQVTLSELKVANSQGVTSNPTAGRAGNYLYVYKSVPTFTVGTIPALQGLSGTTSLYDFKVSADSKGPVYLKQLMFNATITHGGASSAPVLSAFSLYNATTGLTVATTITDGSGNNLLTTNTIGAGANTVVVTFNTQEAISSTSEYVLKATASSFLASSNGGDSVAVNLLSDSVPASATNTAGEDQTKTYLAGASATAPQYLNAAASQTTGTSANVIWSDGSANVHSTTTNDWFNGYLIKNLPLDSVTISK